MSVYILLSHVLPSHVHHYKLALPRDSNGSSTTQIPAAIKSAPLVYTGADVVKSAYVATIGCILLDFIARNELD